MFCRLCLAPEEDHRLKSLFDKAGGYNKKLKLIAGIDLVNDGTQFACRICIDELDRSFQFRLQVKDADAYIAMTRANESEKTASTSRVEASTSTIVDLTVDETEELPEDPDACTPEIDMQPTEEKFAVLKEFDPNGKTSADSHRISRTQRNRNISWKLQQSKSNPRSSSRTLLMPKGSEQSAISKEFKLRCHFCPEKFPTYSARVKHMQKNHVRELKDSFAGKNKQSELQEELTKTKEFMESNLPLTEFIKFL